MSSVPQNILVNVPTYQKSMLASLRTINPFLATLNHRYKNFTNAVVNNLGPSVTLDLPPLVNTQNSLNVDFGPSQQRQITLTIDNEIGAGIAFNTQQIVENDAMSFMRTIGEVVVSRIGSEIGANVATHALTDTYRFFGTGSSPINNRLQLAQIIALFKNYGVAEGTLRGYLPDMVAPSIVNSDLNQFVMRRNDDEALSWEIGNSSGCDWMISNLLTKHIAGTEGQAQNTLTVKSVIPQADGAIVGLVLSGTTSAGDVDCFKENDKIWFDNTGTMLPQLQYLVFNKTIESDTPVQCRVTSDAQSNGASEVTISIFPPLYAGAGNTQNINAQIQPGMKVKVVNSRRSGLIVGGDAFFLAMPQLPDQYPFVTANEIDPETNVSIRLTYGSKGPGTNSTGFVWDATWGSVLAPEYGMEVCFPLVNNSTFF